VLSLVVAGAIALLGIGLYGLLISRHLFKLVISLQVLVKAVLIAFIAAGRASGELNLSQSLALSIIVVDTVVAVLGLALAVRIQQDYGTLDVKELSSLRG
jgi:NADH:ubiquinone oxidoreductase subunit K